MAPSALSSVQVVVRLRPLNEKEQQHGTLPVVSANTAAKTVTVLKGQGSRQTKTNFKFDNVFGSFSTQQEVFDATLRPVIRDVLSGFESTVFAYGSTGTGKTHTMEGSLDDPEQFGVIPRSAAAIFSELEKNPEYVSSQVSCSFLEIYNEDLNDLLVSKDNQSPKLSIMEGKNGPFCRGLTEVIVQSAEDLLELMRKAQQQRQVGETSMNKQSSRSHCIFTLKVVAKRKLSDGSILDSSGKLHCCDLAGSENAKAANVMDDSGEQQAARERERMNINRSLLTLGRVVSTLKELSQNPKKACVRIPYRDSKLTRILQESLGGKCKTCVIATISPSVTAIEDSLSTLSYASAANGIVNKPVTTSFMTAGSGTITSILDKKPSATDDGVGSIEHWHEMEVRLEYMKAQVEEAQQALARKHIQHQEFLERAELAEKAQKAAEEKLEEVTKQIAILETTVEETNTKLNDTENALNETTLVLRATQQTEELLTSEAKAILAVLQSCIVDGDSMHRSLLCKQKEIVGYKEGTRTFSETTLELFRHISNALSQLETIHTLHHSDLCEKYSNEKVELITRLAGYKSSFDNLKNSCVDKSRILRGTIHDDLLPSLQNFSGNLKKELDLLDSLTDEGNESLKRHCGVISERLDRAVAFLEESSSKYACDAGTLQNDVASTLTTSKEKMSQIVVKLQELISAATEERRARESKLQEILETWKGSCHATMDANQFLLQNHVQNLNEIISSSLKNNDTSRTQISDHFSQQNASLTSKKDTYFQQLEEQKKTLQQQYEALALAHKRQREKNKSMVKNIMSALQKTVEKEVSEAAAVHTQAFDEFVAHNTKLNTSNGDIASSLVQSFEAFTSMNAKTLLQLQESHDRQDSCFKALKTESQTFSTMMEQNVENGRTAVDGIASESMDTITAIQSDDLHKSEKIITSLSAELEAQESNLSSSIDRTVSSGIASLQSSCIAINQHMQQSLIKNVRSDLLNEIQAPNSGVLAQIKSSVEKIQEEVMVGESVFEKHCNKNLEVVMDMQKLIEHTQTCIERSIDSYNHSVQESSWLEKSMELHGRNVEEVTQTAFKLVQSSVQHVSSFARDVIHAEEEPAPLQDRHVPFFCDEFSSTPHPDVILQRSYSDQTLKENRFNMASVNGPLSTKSLILLKDRGTTASNDNIQKKSSSPSVNGKRASEKAASVSRLGKKLKS
ncbi:kinesin motor domain containing protein [Nitzschia inconspicua]|uniref:Kinesin motor domain containing protein n=1 Tax=Nitzschia inconspicua TaxID=303405 RepID=A0A9K3PJX5_9STRA|nr:kinesin motor domain containing protein [Nitzschia inconspicua]